MGNSRFKGIHEAFCSLSMLPGHFALSCVPTFQAKNVIVGADPVSAPVWLNIRKYTLQG